MIKLTMSDIYPVLSAPFVRLLASHPTATGMKILDLEEVVSGAYHTKDVSYRIWANSECVFETVEITSAMIQYNNIWEAE